MTTTSATGYTENLPISNPQSLIDCTIEVPPLRPHDLLVEVAAVSVNPVDVKLRAASRPHGFRVLGFDAVGTVRAVGDRVTLFEPGDEVWYAGTINRPGSDQRLHLVDERIAGRKPRTLSAATAAGMPLTAITAWETLFEQFRLTPESKGDLLVVGATGGVGSMIVQLAETLLPKVTVIATAATPERASWVRRLGAEYTVDHHGDLAAQVLTIAPSGVDWLFTAHSERQIPLYAKITRAFGQITAIDDGPRNVSPLKARSITWHWELMFTRSVEQMPDMIEQHRLLERVADLVDRGRLRSTVTKQFTPINAANLRAAHELVETGHTLGKITLHGWE